MRTAAIVLIGNELLSGKIRDQNATWLTGRLRMLGVDLRRVVVVPDVLADIVEELQRTSPRVDHVFTSGGVGPTHDDVTMEAVASAFGVPLVEDPGLAAAIQAHFKERTRPEHLRMAQLPEGTALWPAGPVPWPVCVCENVIVLPGVPELFRAKFDAIAERFREGRFYLRSVFLDAEEGSVAAALAAVEAGFAVVVGSYPTWRRGDHRVRVTVEARTPEPVNAAVDALMAALPPEAIVRSEPPVQREDEK